ncbi:uncharacterized protein si:ch211-175m2.4 isoform X2 [Rhinichthys klamathensis goyatoka]|uniref:uncharacterized protein si:ch211-175m2.4 isoform X2 n=1 Tax=Rhinichthys klamathensis goyatoka TaxID=3034132 RepID=UPI0024B58137|nr:uncharacterized protein si:ch211-175m2.4 isoform X2 [Rhinichthys klamathensis goyatoka]
MSKATDVMMSTEVYQQQYDVSQFLKIKPMALGILEILIGLLGLGLTIWNDRPFLLWSPIVFIIIGALTFSAAHTCKPRLVKYSQILSYINFAVAAFSLRSHFYITWPRPVTVSYMNTDLPVNHIVLMGQPDSSAMAHPGTSVLYMMPTADGQVSPALMPMWGPFSNAPPPNYSPVPITPPPTYDQVTAALLLNNSPVPRAPPPAYEYEDLQARR